MGSSPWPSRWKKARLLWSMARRAEQPCRAICASHQQTGSGLCVLPPILADFSKVHPNDVEILTGTRLFNLAQREADVAFRIAPFGQRRQVQRPVLQARIRRLHRRESPDPKYGDGTGFRLITHDTSTGQFPDIAWLTESFPNARPVLRSNNRNVQARMCSAGALGSPSCPASWAPIPVSASELPKPPPARDI